MPPARNREDQPWLKFIVLPFLLIVFGLETSYVYLSRIKKPVFENPIVILTTTPTPVPSITPTTNFCGGIANIQCPKGYKCVLDGKYPDAGGKCLSSVNFSCPSTPWVNCMPGPGPARSQCSSEYLSWAKANCSGFQGAAY